MLKQNQKLYKLFNYKIIFKNIKIIKNSLVQIYSNSKYMYKRLYQNKNDIKNCKRLEKNKV